MISFFGWYNLLLNPFDLLRPPGLVDPVPLLSPGWFDKEALLAFEISLFASDGHLHIALVFQRQRP